MSNTSNNSSNNLYNKNYKIVIHGIDPEYTSDYIIEILYIQHIAMVKRIILVPYVSNEDGCVYMSAYIDVHKWYECQHAREFIKMIKYCPVGYSLLLYHYINLGWPVQLIQNTDSVFELGYAKIESIYYGLEYYENIDWTAESETMELVKAEFIAKQCAENVLNN
jgi:hypothetical protein